jgi:putative glycosyltransferase
VLLSVVTSVYRTAQFLESFASRVDTAARSCGLIDYEMIFVVDGSPDDAIAVLRQLKSRYPAIRAIELSRNFGHHPALWCGLEQARGDLIFLADSDLETPPEILIDLHAALADGDTDVAFAWQRRRAGTWLRRRTSQAFWRAFSGLAEVRIHPDALTERLMRRRYVDALLQLNERALFLGGMMEWVGFRQTPVPATRTPREGRPSYSWPRRAALAFDAITSFSVVPMKALFLAGAGLAAVAMLGALLLVALKLADPGFIVRGFTALAVLLLFSLGSILAALGMVGLYLGKVFLQTKNRPLYVIRREI